MLQMPPRHSTNAFKKRWFYKTAINLFFMLCLMVLSCVTIPSNYEKARIKPLIQGHSHNDYQRKNPLTDAIVLGFKSIEADIHLKDGKLYVAHDEEDIEPAKILESMYLTPLQKLVNRHNGYLYKNTSPLLLFIDIKTNADSTYRVLHETLSNYKKMLFTYNNNRETKGPIKVIISGERPIQLMTNQTERFAALDGRLADLETGTSKTLMPVISDKWTDAFKWNGVSDISEKELQKLSTIVSLTHKEGRLIRFWDTDSEDQETRFAMWKLLLDAHVDLINTDYIDDLQEYLDKRRLYGQFLDSNQN
jgi:hypothetical protein